MFLPHWKLHGSVVVLIAATTGCPGDVVESMSGTESASQTGDSTTTSTSGAESSSHSASADSTGGSSSEASSVGSSEAGSSSDGSSSSTNGSSSSDGSSSSTNGSSSSEGSSSSGASSSSDGSSSSTDGSSSDGGGTSSGTTTSTSTDGGSSSGDTGSNPECGNGIPEFGEACDDGNGDDGDGCDNDCTASAVAVVTAGGQHTCVLLDTGLVRCWGLGSSGQLGQAAVDSIGDDELPSTAVPLDLGGTVVQLTAGYFHNCARLDDGSVRCWGDAEYGQLGYANQLDIGDDEPAGAGGPVDLGGIAIDLVAGYFHTCALLEGGDVRCWGGAGNGQLGYGNTNIIGDDELPSAAGPVDVGMPVVELAAGFLHTCARNVLGEIRCWGAGAEGQLGHADLLTIGDDELPSSVGTVDIGDAAIGLALGGRHSCALLPGGNARCWGSNVQGQLGQGDIATIGDDEPPSAVGPIDVGGTPIALGGGFFHTCAVLDDASARCWGFGMLGELGTADVATIGDDELPTAVPPIDIGGAVTQLSVLNDHTCVLLDDGAVRCWGLGANGQLGYGDTEVIGDDEPPSAAGDVSVF